MTQCEEKTLIINEHFYTVVEHSDDDGVQFYDVKNHKGELIYQSNNIFDWLENFQVNFKLAEIEEAPKCYPNGTFVRLDLDTFGVIIGVEFTQDQPCYCIQEIENVNDEAETRWLYDDEFEPINFFDEFEMINFD